MTMFRIVLITLLVGAATWGMASSAAVAQQTEDDGGEGQAAVIENAAPTGLAVDGIIRSTRGGFAFPNGARMTAPPKLALGGPFECAPAAGKAGRA